MDATNVDSKARTVSSTSSASSVTEYVNELYVESELELSKVVSIDVTDESSKSQDESENRNKLSNNLQDFSDISTLEESSKFIPTGFRKVYLAALIVLCFAVCMGVTATYSATATDDMKKSHSTVRPTDNEISWIGSLMAVGAGIGGTAGVIVPRMVIILSTLSVLSINIATSTSLQEDYSSQLPGEVEDSLRQLMIQNALEAGLFEDNLSKIQDAGFKRAHMRVLNKLPPGFVGVRGRRSEKAKVKDPFPGFLGVRGKKAALRQQNSHESAQSNKNVINMSPLTRYFQKAYLKFKKDYNL